jgi:tetratricopeptide (TPR) repeat protein
LALLFCGICTTYKLLPVILWLGNHALAAVCNTHDLDMLATSKPRLHAALAKNDAGPPFSNLNDFLAAVQRGEYLAIECTGFAVSDSLPHPTGHSRVDGQLSFEGALAAGLGQLTPPRTPFHAIDVVSAWHLWQIPPAPNTPEGPAPILYQPGTRGQAGALSQDIRFEGREQELTELQQFLQPRPDRADDFSWTLWTAPGGQGKSRLAERLCSLAQAEGWRAGFLPTLPPFRDWANWDVTWPTLVVVDQIAHRPTEVRNALLTLSGSPDRILAPLRFLLLERPFRAEDGWAQEFVPTGLQMEMATLFAYAHPPGARLADVQRPLGPLSSEDLWRIIGAVLALRNVPLPNRDETLARLAQIDPQSRPLFAIFAAEAIAAHGPDQWRRWDRQRLTAFVLEREFDLWRRTLLPEGPHVDSASRSCFEEHLGLVSFATIAGGLSAATVERLAGEFGVPVPQRPLPDWLRTMTTYSEVEAEDSLPGLGPDILGELFILDRLTGAFGVDANRDMPRGQTRRLLDIALAIAPFGTLAFISRSIRDFPDHPAVSRFAEMEIPEGDRANYGHYSDYAVHLSRVAMALAEAERLDLVERCYTRLAEGAAKLLTRPDHASFRNELEEARAINLYNRAITKRDRGDAMGMERDLEESVALLDVLLQRAQARGITWWRLNDLWAMARCCRAARHGATDRLPSALADLELVVNQPDVSTEKKGEALLLRGRLREATGERSAAAADYEHILSLPGAETEEVRGLARRGLLVLLFEDAFSSKRKGDLDAALQLLTRIIEQADGEPVLRAMARVDRSAIYLQAEGRDLAAALADCEAVLGTREAPDNQRLQAWNNRCQAYLLRGDRDLAITAANEVLATSIPPGRWWALAMRVRAQANVFLNRFAMAELDFQAILAQDGVDPDLLNEATQLLARCRSLHENEPGEESQ